MVLRFKEGIDGVLFVDEQKIPALYFRKRRKFNGPGDEYLLLVYGCDMNPAEFIFESKELYEKALDMWCEYEKHKLTPSYIMSFDPDKRI